MVLDCLRAVCMLVLLCVLMPSQALAQPYQVHITVDGFAAERVVDCDCLDAVSQALADASAIEGLRRLVVSFAVVPDAAAERLASVWQSQIRSTRIQFVPRAGVQDFHLRQIRQARDGLVEPGRPRLRPRDPSMPQPLSSSSSSTSSSSSAGSSVASAVLPASRQSMLAGASQPALNASQAARDAPVLARAVERLQGQVDAQRHAIDAMAELQRLMAELRVACQAEIDKKAGGQNRGPPPCGPGVSK